MLESPVAVKTIVTTPMAASIAAHYFVELIDVIGLLEKKGEAQQ